MAGASRKKSNGFPRVDMEALTVLTQVSALASFTSAASYWAEIVACNPEEATGFFFDLLTKDLGSISHVDFVAPRTPLSTLLNFQLTLILGLPSVQGNFLTLYYAVVASVKVAL